MLIQHYAYNKSKSFLIFQNFHHANILSDDEKL